MKSQKLNWLILIILLVLPKLLFAFEGKVVGISGGDTIKVLNNGKQVKIRLAAIDTPERGQPYGQAAKRFTANLVAVKNVKVWQIDKDRYGRIIGFVFTGDVNVNKALLEAGLAWHYKRYSRDPELAKLEFNAREAKRGLWQEPNPEPPWKYRKRKK
jgi:endonuclease YncB( thermonuclease family)